MHEKKSRKNKRNDSSSLKLDGYNVMNVFDLVLLPFKKRALFAYICVMVLYCLLYIDQYLKIQFFWYSLNTNQLSVYLS